MIGIVAMNAAGCIGKDGGLPWHHPEDLAYFKRTTLGGTVIMGRRTWDALPKKPLPGRANVVLTRHPEALTGPDVVATDLDGLDDALAGTPRPIFVIGGAEVYAALYERTTTFLVTRVTDEVPDGDTFFPTRLDDSFERIETTELSQACRVERWERHGTN